LISPCSATTRRSAHYKTYGITTWSSLRVFSAVRLGLGCPLSSAEGGVFFGLRAGRSPARAPRSGAGGGRRGGERPRSSDFCAVAGRERASGPTRRAKWVKKWFALRHSAARDLVKDESIEVGEVGSKRPSLGCNGVHVVWCSGLIFWLLSGLGER
jgi:hypothetical protein